MAGQLAAGHGRGQVVVLLCRGQLCEVGGRRTTVGVVNVGLVSVIAFLGDVVMARHPATFIPISTNDSSEFVLFPRKHLSFASRYGKPQPEMYICEPNVAR